MPYTPPSHRSPASSTTASPDASRRPSLQSGARPSLPRSASYLNKHRRTPSVSAVSDGSSASITPQGTSEDLKNMTGLAMTVRQSPPPVTDENGIPKGAIISPPESASSGSDDEELHAARGRNADKIKDLREAVSQIPQPRSPSPTKNAVDSYLAPPSNMRRISLSTTALNELPYAGRRVSHVRSATEPSAGMSKSADNSNNASEDETDEDIKTKPQMVRKKSGELVRPALRPSSRRRPSSMPGTPIFSKAVHFDSHLEHVRHFLQVDRPLAVSAGSSPADNYESDNEYPFPDHGRSGARSPPYEWEIQTCNFPHDSPIRKAYPVRLERVWLSPDQKSLLGSVAVSNLAFHKSVTCRFTLDYWKTTSEISAEYSHEIRPKETPLGQDRFTFSIKLADTANLASKTLFFCIRYSVNGQEFWDNNNSANFQVDFRKKHLPQNGKNNFQGASTRPLNGLPRSNRRHSPANTQPKSMPAAMDDFDHDSKFNFDQPIHEYLGESGPGGLRLKSKSASNLASDNIATGLSSPSGAAFANRYDFGASLTAAVQAAKDSMGKEKDRDALYMRSHVRGSGSSSSAPATSMNSHPTSRTGSPNLSLPSASYEELVNKYCFFGSKQSSPEMRDGTLSSDRRHESSMPRHDGAGSQDCGHAQHHAIRIHSSGSPLPAASFTLSSTEAHQQDRTHQGPAQKSFSLPATPPASDVPYHAAHQVLAERFPWGGDSHSPAAIRG
ncbi:hypothetical protein NLU13_2527 [Sarocladium strictum]|uniref:CBM21 domain-containing protein n=1 Tax=Sarocladium strictum TaxID=5046 RepID=A0AA39GKC7_SARSR|nr:hypothetical protein NLU13_2527 [Sarocladium strictum]